MTLQTAKIITTLLIINTCSNYIISSLDKLINFNGNKYENKYSILTLFVIVRLVLMLFNELLNFTKYSILIFALGTLNIICSAVRRIFIGPKSF